MGRCQLFVFGFITIFFTASHTRKMPDFIQTCKRTDPNLDACARRNAELAIPGLVQGAKEYNIPNMLPLSIPRIEIKAGNNLMIELTNNEVNGLQETHVKSVVIDLNNKHMTFQVSIPRANIVGHYKMDGRILILPIRGNGRANITFIDGDYIYSMDYKLNIRKNKEFLEITDHNITFSQKRAYYDFENLFDGDKLLGEQMKKFLDENWEEVTKDMGSTVGETISSIITSIATAIFNKVPFDDVLPPPPQ